MQVPPDRCVPIAAEEPDQVGTRRSSDGIDASSNNEDGGSTEAQTASSTESIAGGGANGKTCRRPTTGGSSTAQAKQTAKAKEGRTWESKKGKSMLYTPCGDAHEWKQWTEYVKHCKKFRCEREGCGFFKKCWTSCEDINCIGCHVPAHKRW